MNFPSSTRRIHPCRTRQGSVLVFAIIAALVVGVVSAGFLGLSSSITKRTALALDQERAFYLAEAGLGEAYSGFVFGKSGNVGTRDEPVVFGDGLFWVEATARGDGFVEMTSFGMCGRGSARLSVVVDRGDVNPLALGVFSNVGLIIEAGTLIDSFDSSKGGYKDPNPGRGGGHRRDEARVGSNEGILIRDSADHPTRIDGDVVPGKDCRVATEGDPVITGEIESGTMETKLPDVETPDVDMKNGIVHDQEYPLMIRSGTFGYESLEVAPNSDLILSGPLTLVLDSFVVQPEGSLEFDTTDGPIELYVSDILRLDLDSLVSTSSEDPSQVSIYFAEKTDDDPVLLGAKGEFYGTLFGPEAEVQIDADFELFGAIVVDHLLLGAGAKLHFDLFLAALAMELSKPSFVSWQFLGFADPAPGMRGSDPFRKLGIVRDGLPLPADAHEDQLLEIQYYDLAGDLQNYVGMESDFDWTQVDTVVGGFRDGRFAAVTGSEGTILVK